MDDFLQSTFLNNSMLTWLEVIGTILFAFLLKRFISKYIAVLLFKIFIAKDKTERRKEFVNLVIQPIDNFIFLFVFIAALDKLQLPHFLQFSIYHIPLPEILRSLGSIALIVTFIRLCSRLIKFVANILQEKANLTEDQTDNQLIVFFRDFLRVVIYIIGALLILSFSFHYDISKLVTGLSIVGAAIALATKESLENLIASFIIFFDKPFTTGDLVKVQGFTGTVERIGLRSTRIRTDQKTYITVPNKQMVDTILDNISLRTQRRGELRLEISLSATIEQLKTVELTIKKILQHPAVVSSTVLFAETGKNAHVITVEFFTTMSQSNDDFNTLRENINFEIIQFMHNSNIKLAAG